MIDILRLDAEQSKQKELRQVLIQTGMQCLFNHGLTFMQSGRYTQGIIAQGAIHLGWPTRGT